MNFRPFITVYRSSGTNTVSTLERHVFSDELSDEELVKSVNSLKRQVRVISLENELLERAIMRLDPSLMLGVQQAFEYALRFHSSSSFGAGGSFLNSSKIRVSTSERGTGARESIKDTPPKEGSPGKEATTASKVSMWTKFQSSANIGAPGQNPRVNLLEKLEYVGIEMRLIMEKLSRAKSRAASRHAMLSAKIEETGIRMVDIDRALEAFNDEVIVKGWNKIAQRIPAEVWVRFMSEWMKTRDKEISRLRLRTSTLNITYRHLTSQTKTKRELHDLLCPVDFEKMTIENSELKQLIAHKVNQLHELKKMTGDANLALKMHKDAVLKQAAYLRKVQKDIVDKDKMISLLDKQRDTIDVQARNLAKELENVKRVRLEHEVPDILDYVKVKAEVCDLRRSVKTLENRFRVQQITLKSLNKKLQSMYVIDNS